MVATPAGADTLGRINTVSGAPVPAGATITVIALDANEWSGALQPEIEAALRGHGYAIDSDGPWQLRFTTALDEMRRGRPYIRLMGRLGSNSRADLGVEVPLPQWPGPETADKVYRYNVSMTLGLSGHPAIWQGAATAIRPDRDSFATDKALTAALLARFGETVADGPLPLP